MSGKDASSFSQGCSRVNLPVRLTVSRILAGILFVIVAISVSFYQFPGYSPQFYDALSQTASDDVGVLVVSEPAIGMTKYKSPLLPVEQAEQLCAGENLKPFPNRERHRKVYDLFLVGTELDWTEIRINELAPHVDYFVILESGVTFTNHTKPRYFKKNWKHFQQFESQIIYHAVNDEAAREFGNPWDREHYQRNALLKQVFPDLLGEKAPNDGDVLLVSDVDEIPRPETIEKLRNCDIPERTGLKSRFFLYSFQWHRDEGDWGHPQATFWQGENTVIPESLRMTHTSHDFANASWHCTTCFQTVAELISKIESFSHQEWNKPEFKSPAAIVRRVRNGTDVFERGFRYEKVEQDQLDIPGYMQQHRERFAYLLDRDPPNGNFRDYFPMLDLDSFDRSGD